MRDNRDRKSRNREFSARKVSVHFSHTCFFVSLMFGRDLFSPTNLQVRTTRCPTNFYPASATLSAASVHMRPKPRDAPVMNHIFSLGIQRTPDLPPRNLDRVAIYEAQIPKC